MTDSGTERHENNCECAFPLGEYLVFDNLFLPIDNSSPFPVEDHCFSWFAREETGAQSSIFAIKLSESAPHFFWPKGLNGLMAWHS